MLFWEGVESAEYFMGSFKLNVISFVVQKEKLVHVFLSKLKTLLVFYSVLFAYFVHLKWCIPMWLG